MQVGKDQAAQAFLANLDNDPVVGRMVDATSYYELEAMEYQRKGIVLTPGGHRLLSIFLSLRPVSRANPSNELHPTAQSRLDQCGQHVKVVCQPQISGWSS